jgi:hypothetical protein
MHQNRPCRRFCPTGRAGDRRRNDSRAWGLVIALAQRAPHIAGMSKQDSRARALGLRLGQMLVGIHRRVPSALRPILGLLLIVGGVAGFLPVLGFWMIPLGIAVIGLDIVLWWRAWKRRRTDHRRSRSSDFR